MFPSCANMFVERNFVQKLYFLYFFLSNTFRLLRSFESFSILFQIGLWLFDISSVVNFCFFDSVFSYRGPVEATFSSWILSSGLSCAHKLRASNMKHNYSWFLHSQRMFVDGSPFCLFRAFESFSISDTGCLIFICCHSCVNLILFVSFWGPMEVTFLSWILSDGYLAFTALQPPT